MNDNKLIQELKELSNLEPRAEVMLSVRNKMKTLKDREIKAPQKMVISPFSAAMYATALMSFVLVVVMANQLPMHNAYRDSISMIAVADKTVDGLEKSKYPAQTAHEVLAATKKARETLDTLQLKGEFAKYSQEQCREAYTIYDSYLDYLGDFLDQRIPETTDTETKAAFRELRTYVTDSQAEALNRINMYPQQ